jgi:hypothetical protein
LFIETSDRKAGQYKKPAPGGQFEDIGQKLSAADKVLRKDNDANDNGQNREQRGKNAQAPAQEVGGDHNRQKIEIQQECLILDKKSPKDCCEENNDDKNFFEMPDKELFEAFHRHVNFSGWKWIL